MRLVRRPSFAADIVPGITLAAVAIPACMGYTKIAGTPVVTGLYTILLPAAAFAILGSSRRLIVAADSATAAILYAGLVPLAQPFSGHWLGLAGGAALLTAAFLALAFVFRLGFLADFLSRTVLVGFLCGVGLALMIDQLPDMMGIPSPGGSLWHIVAGTATRASHAHVPTLAMSGAVVVFVLVLQHVARRIPAMFVAVVLAIGLTWAFGLDRHGIALVGQVQAGLPAITVPAISKHELAAIVPMCLSLFLVVIAQSAATARSFAQKHEEPLDENRDLLALAAANALAGLSSTFVVNGSPTKTAVAEAAGAQSQATQLISAIVVLVVLIAATPLIARLPVGVLAALVFLIGLKLLDIRSLHQIRRFRRTTFAVALGTLVAVLAFGIERGIFVAIALSVIDHLQQEHAPKDVVLTLTGGRWRAENVRPGIQTEPGLVLYRFQAPLFFANADYFAARVEQVVDGAKDPVRWLLLDLISVDDIDYTAGLMLSEKIAQLQQRGIQLGLISADDLREPLDRLDITPRIGSDRFYASVQDAAEAFHAHAGLTVPEHAGNVS